MYVYIYVCISCTIIVHYFRILSACATPRLAAGAAHVFDLSKNNNKIRKITRTTHNNIIVVTMHGLGERLIPLDTGIRRKRNRKKNDDDHDQYYCYLIQNVLCLLRVCYYIMCANVDLCAFADDKSPTTTTREIGFSRRLKCARHALSGQKEKHGKLVSRVHVVGVAPIRGTVIG